MVAMPDIRPPLVHLGERKPDTTQDVAQTPAEPPVADGARVVLPESRRPAMGLVWSPPNAGDVTARQRPPNCFRLSRLPKIDGDSAGGSMRHITHILAAIDFSDESAHALDHAIV